MTILLSCIRNDILKLIALYNNISLDLAKIIFGSYSIIDLDLNSVELIQNSLRGIHFYIYKKLLHEKKHSLSNGLCMWKNSRQIELDV